MPLTVPCSGQIQYASPSDNRPILRRLRTHGHLPRPASQLLAHGFALGAMSCRAQHALSAKRARGIMRRQRTHVRSPPRVRIFLLLARPRLVLFARSAPTVPSARRRPSCAVVAGHIMGDATWWAMARCPRVLRQRVSPLRRVAPQ